jgi:hypothetical protein
MKLSTLYRWRFKNRARTPKKYFGRFDPRSHAGSDCAIPAGAGSPGGTTARGHPTLRIYRQPQPGDWNSVLAEVTRDLKMAPVQAP